MAVLGVAAAIIALSAKSYPDCNDRAATAALAKLYDNRRLLHAVNVVAVRLLSDGIKGRYCRATVTWDNGSVTEVPYSFHRAGRYSRSLAMWIDHNGGMNGPFF